jgi:hypothetical protein
VEAAPSGEHLILASMNYPNWHAQCIGCGAGQALAARKAWGKHQLTLVERDFVSAAEAMPEDKYSFARPPVTSRVCARLPCRSGAVLPVPSAPFGLESYGYEATESMHSGDGDFTLAAVGYPG